MPRETLHQLARDVERLLLAGAATASADAGLAARGEALAALGAAVPVLGRVAAQVAKVRGARAREAARALLGLATMVAQVRGALVVPADAPTPLAPLPPAASLDTPLACEEVEALHRALTTPGEGRREAIERAAAEDRVRDLRLLDPWLDALADPHVGPVVAARVMPRLGEAAVAPLLGALDLRGAEADARRLASLAAIQGGGARDVLARALAEGAGPVRAAAVEALAGVDLAAAEGVALAMAASDRAEAARAAALRVLGRAATDAALDALVAALGDARDEVQKSAVEALGATRHPAATARVLALLTPDALDLLKNRATRKYRPADDERARGAAGDGRVRGIAGLLGVLGARRDPDGRARLATVLREHAHPAVRRAAGEALLRDGDATALAALAAALEDDDADVRGLGARALGAMPPAAAYERAAPWLDDAALATDAGVARAAEALEAAAQGGALDPRWATRALALLAREDLRALAIEVLVRLRDGRLVEPLLGWLADGAVDAPTALDALGRLGDRRATPAVLALVEGAGGALRYYVFDALRRLDDPAAAPALRAVLARAGEDGQLAKLVQDLLNHLERERATAPGG